MSEDLTIIQQLNSDDGDVIREGAYLAGKERYAEAIPLLTEHLHSSDIGVQEAAERALRKIGGPAVVHAVIPLLRSDDAPVRNIGMDLLREVGVTDLETLAKLLHDNDPDIRIFVADILGATGSALAVAPLCAALLKDPEVNVRYQAAVSLGNLAFPEAANNLNKALEDDEWVRFSVIEALTKIRAESSVGALVKALDHSSELVASVIVDALGEMGNLKAAPLLIRRLDATTGPLRNKIVAAIIKILGGKSLSLLGSKEQENLFGYMIAAMADDDSEVQDTMIQGLSFFKKEEATEAVLKLALGLDPDRDHERLLMIIEALAKIGYNPAVERALRSGVELAVHLAVEVISLAPARAAVKAMEEVFWDSPRDLQRAIIAELATQSMPEDQDFFLDVLDRHPDGTVLKSALIFLGRKGEASEVGEKVAGFLDHPYNDVKEAALDACIALHDPVITGYLLSMATEEEPFRRMMAVYALTAIDLTAYGHIVAAALKDPVEDVRKVALEALEKQSPLSREFMALVEGCVDDPSSDVRLQAITILSHGDEARLGPHLLKGLVDPDPWVRVRCIETIGRFGMRDAVPQLIELLDSDNELILIKAVEALGSIGGEAAFRSLFTLMDHENPEIQQAAEEAMERIRAGEGA